MTVGAKQLAGMDAVRYDFLREQLAEIEEQIAGKIKLPKGAADQLDNPELVVKPGEKTAYAVILRRLGTNSLYYGAFYDFEKQKEGKEIVWPILDVDPDTPLADCE